MSKLRTAAKDQINAADRNGVYSKEMLSAIENLHHAVAEEALDEIQRLTESEYREKSALEKLTETHKKLLEAFFVKLEHESKIWDKKQGIEEQNFTEADATARFLAWNEVIVGLAMKAEREAICQVADDMLRGVDAIPLIETIRARGNT
jgi:hypothetical protein